MFVLYALYPSPCFPRHRVTPGADQHSLAVPKSITPTNPPPLPPSTTGVNVLALQRPRSIPTLPSKEKQNQTEKRQNGPTLLPLSKLLTGPSRGPQRRVQWKMMTTEITSQVVVLQHSYTLALFVHLVIQKHRGANWFPCMSCLVTWHTIKCCFTSVCGAWRVSEELVIQENRNKHSIRY